MYSDAHCHSNPIEGLGAGYIARKFRSMGGWFIALIGLPPHHYGINGDSIEDYLKAYEITISEARKIREEGLKTKVLVGFHPAEVDHYVKKGRNLEEIIEFAEKLFKEITRLHQKGLIDGIGEVGRQHYSTSPPRLVASELIMAKALEIARDYDMIVHLHLEQGGFATVESINLFTKVLGVPKNLVFLHHVGYNEAFWGERQGFWYTVPAKEKTLVKTLGLKPLSMLTESDFIDDPRRPGVSSYPWNIPVIINKLLSQGIIDEDLVYRIEVDNIVKAYNVNPP
ncbi:MAG: TatD family hydrolase [Desulfurococcales archaeon]|nr:TatD family hydrolase [Desulfurococcales archaeon]